MPKKSEDGKDWIFAAGEVANYEVCPYAWYLEHIQKVSLTHPKFKDHGQKKHEIWVTQANRTYFYSRSFRIIIYALIILVLLIFATTFQ